MGDLSRRCYAWWIVALVILRWLMVLGVRYGWPSVEHTGWIFHHGGDQVEYFRVASALAHGQWTPTFRVIGFPLFLVPFIWMTGATDVDQIIAPVALCNACVLMGGSILLIGEITRRICRRRRIAVLAALLWTIRPYVTYALVRWCYPQGAVVAQVWLAHALGLQVLRGSLSLFCVLCTMYLNLVAAERASTRYCILAGMMAGIAAQIRSEHVLLVGLGTLWHLHRRAPRHALGYLGGAFALLAPQLALNMWQRGAPWAYGIMQRSRAVYEAYGADAWAGGVMSWKNAAMFLQQLWGNSALLGALFVIGILLPLILANRLRARAFHAADLLLLWFYGYLGFYLCYWGFLFSPWRYLRVCWPPATIFVAISVYDLCRLIRQRRVMCASE